MLNAIILESCTPEFGLISNALAEHCKNVNIVETVHTADECYLSVILNKPDVVFLDLDKDDCHFFNVIENMREVDFEIVVSSGSHIHAYKALRCHAADYLLKPAGSDAVIHAVDKVEEKRRQSNHGKSLQSIFTAMKRQNEKHKIAISTSEGLIFKKVSKILYLESEGSYTNFFFKDGSKIMTSKNLKEYEELLDEHDFFRIHKSYYINMREVEKYVRGEGGYVIMSDTKMLDVAKRKKDDFYRMLENLGIMDKKRTLRTDTTTILNPIQNAA